MEHPKLYSGYILNRNIYGEKFWQTTIFTEDYGACSCLIRIAGKNKTLCVPDLFDKAEIFLDKPKNDTENALRFGKEYRLIKRNLGISRDYTALISAGKFTTLLAKNAFSSESSPKLYKLCENVLTALAEKPRPDVTYFKALWSVAKEGGYPVKEDWFENSRFEERDEIAFILKTPLEQQNISPRELAYYSQRLENWLIREHQFILEP